MIDLRLTAELRDAAANLRKRGDALRRRANAEREAGHIAEADNFENLAAESFTDALEKLDSAIDALGVSRPGPDAPVEPPPPDDPLPPPDWASEASDTFGTRGGILSRLGRDREALVSYQTGGLIERAHDLTTTYCRGNVVKLSLQLRASTLDELSDDIEELRDTLAAQMSSQAVDQPPNPWAYADLGDYQLMLNDIGSARSTYASFVRLAAAGSPEKTWKALNNLVDGMHTADDPSASRFAGAVEEMRPVLKPDVSTA